MKNNVEKVVVIPNRTLEITNLYQKQSLKLIDLVLTHNRDVLESSQKRISELLQEKDSKNIHILVTAHLSSQIHDYLNFAIRAYQLGVDSHSEVVQIFQQQIFENHDLNNEILKHPAMVGNPLTSMALSIINNALNTSKSVIDSASTASTKAANFTKASILNKTS